MTVVDPIEGADVDRFGVVEGLVGADLVDRSCSCHDQRVAVIGAEVRHPAVDDDLHDVLATTKRRERQPAADALGERDEVGLDAEALGGTGIPGGETGLDLVKDQDDPELIAQCAHRGEIALVGDDDGEVLDHGLHDERGNLAAMLAEDRAQRSRLLNGTT
jgi:hypothetical protein